MSQSEHVDAEQLHALLAGTLGPAEKYQVLRHLKQCSRCETAAQQIDEESVGRLLNESTELSSPEIDQTVLHSIFREHPHIPHVVLRDGDDSTQGIVRPNSSEMPRGERGKYQIQGEIARGGMGAILKGRDTDLGRDLAIKVLLADHKEAPGILNRFVEEAQIGGQLQHPGVVPVYELGQFDDDRPYFTMKLVKGETLASILSERTNPDEGRAHALGIFGQVCQTMAYAHSKGVIHRDLKPSNVMVGTYGEVQVMDWGLAKVLPKGGVADEKKSQIRETDPDPETQFTVIQTLRSVGSDTPGSYGSQTHYGSVMGTPAYMSPEQALGELDRLDERADVFSLGSILCHILTGKPAYVGGDAQEVFRLAMRGRTDDALQRLDTCGAGPELVGLCRSCLEFEPSNRPRDAAALAAQFTNYLESAEQRAHDSEMQRVANAARLQEAENTAREEQRRRRATMITATSICLALLVGFGAWGIIQKQRREVAAREEQSVLEVSQSIRAKLTGAEGLLEESQEVLGAESQLVRRARDLAKEAQALAKTNGIEVGLREQVRDMMLRLDTKEADRILIAQLESIGDKGTFYEERWPGLANENVDEQYEQLFAELGLVPLSVDSSKAAADVGEMTGRIRVAVQSAMEEWAYATQREPYRAWLYAVLERVDTADPWRIQLHAALGANDLEQLTRLAASADVSVQPAVTVRTLAWRLDLDDRLALLERAQLARPNNFWINLDLSITLASTQRFSEAVRYATAAVALRPTALAYQELAWQLRSLGDAESAIEIGRKVTQMAPHYLTGFFSLGKALSKAEEFEEAIKAYESVIQLAPTFLHLFSGEMATRAAAHHDLAVCQTRLGNHSEAASHYYAAARVNGFRDSTVLENWAASLRTIQETNEALAAAIWAVESSSDRSGAVTLANTLEAAGRPIQAVVEYFVANDAVSLQRLGLLDEAIAHRHALAEEVNDAASWIGLSKLYRSAHRGSAAIQAARRAVTADEDNVSSSCRAFRSVHVSG